VKVWFSGSSALGNVYNKLSPKETTTSLGTAYFSFGASFVTVTVNTAL
jgi:hypothetical protein